MAFEIKKAEFVTSVSDPTRAKVPPLPEIAQKRVKFHPCDFV